MQVDVAVLADCANIAEGGKLNVMGMFDRIWATEFPATHAFMVLAVRMRLEYGDEGNHRFEIDLHDEDGAKFGGVVAELTVGKIMPGQREVVSQILSFPGLRFPRPGEYGFTIRWDGTEKATVPLSLVRPPAPPPA